MFGYVSPLKCELKVRELAQYDAYYCGLCKTIGERYSQTARMVLNYDCCFLALLLAGVAGAKPCMEKACGYKPLRKKRPVAVSSAEIDFAADVNVLLAYHKLNDDWQDEKKLTAATGKAALSGDAKKAKRNRPDVDEAIRNGIAELTGYEKRATADIDAPAEAFAKLMCETLRCSQSDKNGAVCIALGQLGYHMGRWIYLMDAWDDREKDKKSGSYNPFIVSKADKERASFLLHMSLNEAVKAYDLLDIKANKGVLDNIMYYGNAAKTESLLNKGDEV